MLHGLLVRWPILVAQVLGLAAQVAAIMVLGQVLPGVHVGDPAAAVWGAVLLTVLNSLFAELVAVSDDDSYYSVLVRRLVAREYRTPDGAGPGAAGRPGRRPQPPGAAARRSGPDGHPCSAGWCASGEATLHPWIAMLPPTTPASQGGILHGNNTGIAGFRWYEKATARLLVANHPEDATEIVRRISDGKGLLADDGASIGNLMTGDAPRSYLTMATIEQGAAADDERRMRGFFVTTVNYIRLLVLMGGEVAKELYQAERQRGRSVEPRMHRDLHFAIERAATNIALRTVSTALVIEEMYGGAPTIYVDYTGYDAIAHHCGPERAEAIDALEGIDRAIGSLLKAARYTGRPYRMVVLSDHGQCLGATFQQRYGQPLEAVIAGHLPGIAGRRGHDRLGRVGRLSAGGSRPSSGGARAWVRWWHAGCPARCGAPAGAKGATPEAAPPDVVVASSGNLAHVYFTSRPERMTGEAIEARHPGLIGALAQHPGIGAVIARSAAGHPVVFGAQRPSRPVRGPARWRRPPGRLRSPGGGETCGASRASRTPATWSCSARSTTVTGEVTGFEELVGSHGGLGGWQTRAVHPVPGEPGAGRGSAGRGAGPLSPADGMAGAAARPDRRFRRPGPDGPAPPLLEVQVHAQEDERPQQHGKDCREDGHQGIEGHQVVVT